MRAREACPHRGPAHGSAEAEVAECRLLSEITGIADFESRLVSADACLACCASPVPTAERINPVLASLLSRLADDVITQGGRGECDVAHAESIRERAHQHLQIVLPLASDRVDYGEFWDEGTPSVAVVIPCHNYGRYVAEAIESVLGQTVAAREVVVVDDASTDETAEVAARYRGTGVRYIRVEHRNAYQARRAGLEATASEFLCFLDADDALPPNYLARGLPLFENPRTGIVYSDVTTFGDESAPWEAPAFDRLALELRNSIHAGALVRRRALQISEAFDVSGVASSHADWFVWRRVVEAGWHAVKQPAVYRYRRHAGSLTTGNGTGNGHLGSEYDFAQLNLADVTIFTPLSGRTAVWDPYRDWLLAQSWPRAQCRLILMDTSGSADFARVVRQFVADAPYPDVRYMAQTVGPSGLANKPRLAYVDSVRLACARIYNRMAREVVTPFVLVVEDDVIPPIDVIEQLMRGMDANTAAVTSPYLSRFTSDYCLWDDDGEYMLPIDGYQPIGGSGFGCLLLRRAALAGETFLCGYAEMADYDRAYAERLRRDRWTIKAAWHAISQHLHSGGTWAKAKPDVQVSGGS